MSGERLREAAMVDDHQFLAESIRSRSNVCSGDEWGLTPLHYAVWNGHVESVKYLALNPNGVDNQGNRTSCVNLKSCIGLTPLHLAAMDCPPASVVQITRILLLVGADPRVADDHGRSAYLLARESRNQAFLDVVQEYVAVRNGSHDPTAYQTLFKSLDETYRLIDATVAFRVLDAEFLASLPFVPPEFLGTQQRVGEKPRELSIHEHHIMALAEHANTEKTGIDALKALDFAQQQAAINMQRRLKLAQIAEAASKINGEPKPEIEHKGDLRRQSSQLSTR